MAASRCPSTHEITSLLAASSARVPCRNLWSYVLVLAVQKSPHFVQLNALTFQVAEHTVLIISAHGVDFSEKPHDTLLGDTSSADGGANRAAFDEATNHVRAGGWEHLVCSWVYYALALTHKSKLIFWQKFSCFWDSREYIKEEGRESPYPLAGKMATTGPEVRVVMRV